MTTKMATRGVRMPSKQQGLSRTYSHLHWAFGSTHPGGPSGPLELAGLSNGKRAVYRGAQCLLHTHPSAEL